MKSKHGEGGCVNIVFVHHLVGMTHVFAFSCVQRMTPLVMMSVCVVRRGHPCLDSVAGEQQVMIRLVVTNEEATSYSIP